MIKHISGSVTFITPPITLEVDFQPSKGITAVVGPNGSGKSFAAVELARFLLFGKAALRGTASDYKTLEAEGVFAIRGVDYHIYRGPRQEYITEHLKPEPRLAVGAKAVTEKVTELMGYGLPVFDIANASVQKQADNFGKMPPVERKRLIDRVVGITSLEIAEKACREEAKMQRREAAALEQTLPLIPELQGQFTRFSDEIAKDLAAWERYDAVQRRVVFVQRPERPTGTLPTPEALKALEDFERARLGTIDRRAALARRLVDVKAELLHPLELDKAEARARVAKALADRGPAPQLPAAEVERYWAQHALFDAYEPSPEIECPNCQHHFHVTGTPPATPMFSKELLRDEDARRARHAAGPLVLPEGPDLTLKEIAWQRLCYQQLADNHSVQKEIDSLSVPEDRSAELAQMREAQAAWAAYSIMQAAADKAEAQNAAVVAELEALGNPPAGSIESLRRQLTEAQRFEIEWAARDRAIVQRAALTEKITEHSRLAEEFAKGAAAVSDARTTMKAYLAPAMSRAASSLITDMTHGKLSSIVVDEDMEITVNGQRIETLSGGGETVANIALRIALGQVLVVDTFPVFIGDEMDSDADEQRREAVIESLVSLKEHLDQIIVVTHRGVEVADHVFDMRDTK